MKMRKVFGHEDEKTKRCGKFGVKVDEENGQQSKVKEYWQER
jgi:hypothetical protein